RSTRREEETTGGLQAGREPGMFVTWCVIVSVGLVAPGAKFTTPGSYGVDKTPPPSAGMKCVPLAFRTTYSPLHYWTPCLYRARACIHKGTEYIYPPGYQEKRFTLKKAENSPKKPSHGVDGTGH